MRMRLQDREVGSQIVFFFMDVRSVDGLDLIGLQLRGVKS